VGLVVIQRLGHVDLRRGIESLAAPSQTTTRSSCCETCFRSLPHEIPLKLGKRAKDMDDKFASAGGRIDLFGKTPNTDPALIQLAHYLNEVLERAAEPIEPPDDQGFSLAEKQ